MACCSNKLLSMAEKKRKRTKAGLSESTQLLTKDNCDFGNADSSKTGVAKVFNISQTQASIGTVKLGDTGSGMRDMAWLPAEVR